MMEERIAQCQKCELHKKRTRPVIWRGNKKNPKYLFIGEAPGREEDLEGIPFVGKCGKILDKWITELGIKEEEYCITNAVKCRPPNNRPPTRTECNACNEYLIEQIKELAPHTIIPVGSIALQSIITKYNTILKHVGKVHTHDFNFIEEQQKKLNGILRVIPIPHPSYTLRNRTYDIGNVLKEVKKIIK